MGRLIVAAALALACGSSAASMSVTEADLASATLYDNGALTSPWYNNSWSASITLNSTAVLFNGKHTAKVSYQAWGAFVLADGSTQVPGGAYDTLSFYVYNGSTNAHPNLAAQLYLNNSAWGPVVALSGYCSISPAAWVQCNLPLAALGAASASFSEVLIGENAGKSTPSIYFSTIQLSSGAADAGPPDAGPADAGVDAGTDAGVDAGPPDAGPSDAGSDAGPPDAGQDAGPPPDAGSAAMPHLSGRAAFASEGTASLLTDGAYRAPNAWTFVPSHCTAAAPCFAAVNVGVGPASLLIDWSYQDGSGGFDTRPYGGGTVSAYSVQTSSDSTNGRDGTWTTAAAITANSFIQRSHVVPFAGFSWVRLAITSSSANEIDELDLWDATAGTAPSYFFHGDSITQRCANMRGTDVNYGEQPSFQADVTGYPLQIGGGIVGQGAADAAREIGSYLSTFPHVRNWVLTMGTNDLCGTTSAFSSSAQSWINAVKAAGSVPMLVHPIWGNNVASYCSSSGPAFNAAVDALVASNGLSPAVPLYEATVGHPEYFDPGDVHPNASGCHIWNQTFAGASR